MKHLTEDMLITHTERDERRLLADRFDRPTTWVFSADAIERRNAAIEARERARERYDDQCDTIVAD